MELNKIYNEDCIKTMRKMPDNYIDLTVTSPPYNCGIDYDTHNDNMEWRDYLKWCRGWLKELYRVTKHKGRLALNILLNMRFQAMLF